MSRAEDLNRVSKSREILDTCFDHFETSARVLREGGGEALADKLEEGFMPLHDRALANHAAFANAVRMDDREQATAHAMFLRKTLIAIADLAATSVADLKKHDD